MKEAEEKVTCKGFTDKIRALDPALLKVEKGDWVQPLAQIATALDSKVARVSPLRITEIQAHPTSIFHHGLRDIWHIAVPSQKLNIYLERGGNGHRIAEFYWNGRFYSRAESLIPTTLQFSIRTVLREIENKTQSEPPPD